MKINFSLNGKNVDIETPSETRLSDILKGNAKIDSIHSACNKGECRSCTILFNGDAAASCLIPAFEVRSSEVVTLEGFSKTDDYHDIMQALEETGTSLCDLCRGGTILTIYSILERFAEPDKGQILDAFSGKICPCTNIRLIIQVVKKTALYRRRKRFGRK